jgi:hypothetical protein
VPVVVIVLCLNLRGNIGFCMLYFCVIPRRLNFICRRFGTHCSIFIGR